MLLITGLRSRYVADTEVIHKEMAPGTCSMIKVKHLISIKSTMWSMGSLQALKICLIVKFQEKR